MSRRRIGFVDYRLDNFHANTYLRAIRGPLADRKYEVVGATALEADSQTWARQNDVPWYDRVADLAEHCDAFVILAPSNPERHWELCRATFPWGKITFVDKTFAPDQRTAEEIFTLADQYQVPVQTTSALRYTAIQPAVREAGTSLVHLYLWAGGASWEEYGIHPVELAVSSLGTHVSQLLRVGPPDHGILMLEYAAGQRVIIDFNAGAYVDFTAVLSTHDQNRSLRVDDQRLFTDAAGAILDFFDAGKPLVPREETLLIRRILDVVAGDVPSGRWVPL